MVPVRGSSSTCAAWTIRRCPAELLGSLFRICSAMARALAGLVRTAIWPLATSGEELAPLSIFLKKPPPPPVFLSCNSRSALRHSKNPGSFSST